MRKLILLFSALGLIAYLLTGLWNVGIIAFDDYTDHIRIIVPAQHRSMEYLIEMMGVRSPAPSVLLLGLTKLFHSMGVEQPTLQLGLVLTIIGFVAFAVIARITWILFDDGTDKGQVQALIGLILVGLFFACPLFMTRPMYETLAAPWLLVSGLYACHYWKSPNQKSLLWSLFWLAFACMWRPHVGVCLLALLALIVLTKGYRFLPKFIALGLVLAFLSGLPDYYMRGAWHYSLYIYFKYNVAYQASYGVVPWYCFPLVFLGLSIPPTFFGRFPGFKWKQEYNALFPLLLFFLTFVIGHSIIEHKEERFMIPILPTFLALLVPMLYYFYVNKRTWRLVYFGSVNAVLLVVVSISIPQNNVIALARYIDKNPDIHQVKDLESSVVLYPDAFIRRKVPLSVVKADELSLNPSCHEVVAVREDREEAFTPVREHYEEIATFRPGIIEGLIVKANRAQNFRRASIRLYAAKNCSFSE